MATNPILNQVSKSNSPAQDYTVQTPEQVQSSADVIFAAMQESKAATDTATEAAVTRVNSTQNATDLITSALTSQADAMKTVQLIQDTAELQAQTKTKELFDIAGGYEQQKERIVELTTEEQKISDLTDKYEQIMTKPRGFGFIGDTIINAFASMRTANELKLAKVNRNQTLERIQNITATQEALFKQTSLAKNTVNSATVAANTAKIATDYTIKAGEYQLQNLNSNASAMQSLVAMRNEQVSQLVRGFELDGDVDRRKIQAERLAYQREEMELQRKRMLEIDIPAAKVQLQRSALALEEAERTQSDRIPALNAQYKDTLKQYNDAVALEEQQVSAVQLAQATAGIPVEDRETISWQVRRGDPKYLKLRDVGVTTSAAETPNFGGTPADAFTTIATIDPDGNMKSTNASRFIDQIQEVAVNEVRTKGLTIKNQEDFDSLFNSTADAVIAAAKSNISTSDNPYHAPPMEVMDMLLQGKDNKLYTDIIKKQGMAEVEGQRILDTTIAAIQAKAITPEQAATDLVNFYKVAASYNNIQDGGFKRYGLPNQTSYNTSVAKRQWVDLSTDAARGSDLALFGALGRGIANKALGRKDQIVNFMDPVEVKRVLAEYMGTTFTVTKTDQTKQQSDKETK